MTFRLQREIDKLKQRIISLVIEVDKTVRISVRSLVEWKVEYAEQAINNDIKVDQMEVDLEEECLKVLALHQPVAHDLRFIIAVLKINNDLERISDLAVNIAERSQFLVTRKRIVFSFDFAGMAEKVQQMLRMSIDALVTLDSKIAYEVCAADDDVDALNRQFYTVFNDVIRKDPDHVDEMTHYLGISRHLERIADLATNIAEDIIYMIDGDIIRHHVENYHNILYEED